MSTNIPGPEFWTRVDAVIDLANGQCGPSHPNDVGASTMYAAARFNAFILAKTTGNAQNMATEKERALDYFTEQFRNMMAANLEDFTVNFGKYMTPDAQ